MRVEATITHRFFYEIIISNLIESKTTLARPFSTDLLLKYLFAGSEPVESWLGS